MIANRRLANSSLATSELSDFIAFQPRFDFFTPIKSFSDALQHRGVLDEPDSLAVPSQKEPRGHLGRPVTTCERVHPDQVCQQGSGRLVDVSFSLHCS